MTNAFLLGVFFMTTTQPQIPVSLTTMISSQLVVAQADDEAPSKEGRARPPRPGMGTRRFMGKKGVRSAVQKRRGDAKKRKDSNVPPGSRGSTAKDKSADDDRGKPEKQDEKRAAAPAAAKKKSSVPKVPEDTSIDYSAREKKGKFTFEFSKAEIIDIVKAISNLTRRNFIIPEKLKSQRITILSPTKISASEAYQVFLAALEVNGITIVRLGKFYKLMESKSAIKSTIPTCVGPDDTCPKYANRMITMLIQLQHIEASQINGVLKSLMSKEGELTIFQPSNALIISEYAPNLTRLRRIIDALDIAGFDDELQLVQIEFATAQEIADKLTQIFEVSGGNTAAKGRPTARARKSSSKEPAGKSDGGEVMISKIIADERTNQIIIKANKRSFEAIKRLISKLDVPISEADQGRVHVYYLENASAEDLSSTLSSLSQGTSTSNQPKRPRSKTGETKKKETADLFEGEIKVTADKATNALIIVASGHDFRALRRIIEKLDIPRRQVYIEAAILEVTVNDTNERSINWHTPMSFAGKDLPGGVGGDGSFGYLQSAQNTGGISPTLAALSSPEALLGMAGGSVVGLVGKGISIPVGDSEITLPSFGLILKALQSSSSAQILSTPHILTTDNEEASIEVGQKIPFRRGTSMPNMSSLGGVAGGSSLSSLSSMSSMFSSTDRIDVSLKLTVTPQINAHNKIRLEIDQQIEDVVGREEQTQQPITANRAVKTVIVLEDQQTVVIGGLIRDRTRESESKIPLLGDLPILGWFFKQRSTEIEKVNLVLILTPYIIHDASDFQKIFERKINEYEEFAASYYGHTSKYRAHINYDRKIGPLAQIARTLRYEDAKLENGGEGQGGSTMVKPTEKSDSSSDEAKSTEPEVSQPEAGSEL